MQTNVAVVGCGRWGQVLARAAVRTPGLRLTATVDADPGRARRLADRVGASRADRSLAPVLESESVDAVLLATPASTHSSLAETVLSAGKHVLVEKPLAFSAAECRRLGDLAAGAGRTLMVGHTFRHSHRLATVVQLVRDGFVGDLEYVHSERLAFGAFREDVDVLWNLGPHDVSILNWLADASPNRVRANLVRSARGVADAAMLTLDYDQFTAQVHLSALHPKKTRRTTIVGSAGIIVCDDVAGTVDLAVRRGAGLADQVSKDAGEAEPLVQQLSHFLQCIRQGREPITGWREGAEVANVLEAATTSTGHGGWVDVPALQSSLPAGV
jgi:predicted dehydrogenase